MNREDLEQCQIIQKNNDGRCPLGGIVEGAKQIQSMQDSIKHLKVDKLEIEKDIKSIKKWMFTVGGAISVLVVISNWIVAWILKQP